MRDREIDSPFLGENLFSGEAGGEAPARRPGRGIESPFLFALEGGGAVPIVPERWEDAADVEGEEEAGTRLEEWLPELQGEDPDYSDAEAGLYPESPWETPELEAWGEPAEADLPATLELEEESPYGSALAAEPGEWEAEAGLDAGSWELEAEGPPPYEGFEAERDPVELELESPPGAPAEIAGFAASFGAEWSRRRGGSPTPEAMAEWLLRDYQDTITAARNRFGTRHTAEALGRAWMVSRREQMEFQLSNAPGVRSLQGFNPPAGAVTLVSSPLIGGSFDTVVKGKKKTGAPVAPLTVRFVEELKRRYPRKFGATNYHNHGLGSFLDRGYSLDLWLGAQDARGFYEPEETKRFVRAVGEAAAAVGLEWRIIYNDFQVAQAINRETGLHRVVFVGKAMKDKRGNLWLNWHGPDPLILHLHLDLGHAAGKAAAPSTSGASRPAPAPAPAPPAAATAELVRFAQRVLNAAEGERLAEDGDPGPLTRAALTRFRQRYALGEGAALDERTHLALAQRALEEIARASIFPQPGVRDAKTEQALVAFRSQRGLGLDARLDAATRAALSAALPRPAQPAPAAPRAGVQVHEKTAAAVERFRPLAEAAGRTYGVDTALILGVMAAESGGNPTLVAASGYTGLMQAGKGEAHKRPETSIDEGARKLRDFRIIMEGVLKARGKRYDALPAAEQLRLLALAYNAGPVTVAKALQYAAEAGAPESWLDPEHYNRALLFTGAYSLHQAASSCLRGVGAAEKEAKLREATGVWNHWRLGTKKVDWRKLPDPPLWSQVGATLPPFVACAIEFRQRSSPNYVAKIMAYRDRFR